MEPQSAPRAAGTFFDRILPAAPPLPNRPDPLAGFDDGGSRRWRGVRSGLWLLRRRFVVWIPAGIVFGLGYLLSGVYQGTAPSFVGTGVSFAALIGAGWLGWERPWLFGLAASLVGSCIYLAGVVYLVGGAATRGLLTTGGFVLFAVTTVLFLLALGLFGGFYGGYIRRRLAAQRRSQPARRSGRGR
jgi:hypothetical protein